MCVSEFQFVGCGNLFVSQNHTGIPLSLRLRILVVLEISSQYFLADAVQIRESTGVVFSANLAFLTVISAVVKS